MKAEKLKIAIRNLIREEVKKIVAEEVSKAMGKVLVEMVKEIKTTSKKPIIESQESEYVQEEIPETVFKTNNPKLNAVLTETARNFTPTRKNIEGSMAELMDGGFDKVGQGEQLGISQPATNMDFIKQMVAQTPTQTQSSVLDSGVNIPKELKNVFKKDFRALMKKMDEQKKVGGGGNIDMSKVLSG